MSLLSVDSVVADDSEVEECLVSSAQPTREASANAARQEKIKQEGRRAMFVICRSVSIRHEPTSPMGSIPHDVLKFFW